MRKYQPIPKIYTEYFCIKQDILACDNLLNPDCKRTCNFAKKYHPVEVGKRLTEERRNNNLEDTVVDL